MKSLSPIQCLSLGIGVSFLVLTSCSTTNQGNHDDLYGDPYGAADTGEYASYDSTPAYPSVTETPAVTSSYPASNPSDYTSNVDYGYSTPAPTPTYVSKPKVTSTPKKTVAKVTPKKKTVAKKSTAKSRSRSHTVRSGENLYRIAQRYGTSYASLQRANGITNPNRIRVGQVLRIP